MSPTVSNCLANRQPGTTHHRFTAFALLLSGSLLASIGLPAIAWADSVTLHPYSMKVVRGQASKTSVAPLASDDRVGQTSQVWSPAPGTSWQIQLQGTLDTSLNVGMYDIDLFDTPASVIDNLKSRNIAVICYFSAGSWEDWRSDAGQIPASVRGASNGWPGEQWLDISAIDALAPVMAARLDLAVARGCDGVDPDNVDGYTNRTGFPLTAQHQLDYNKWLAAEAHARSLSIGLKNNLLQVEELEPYFDWALNESCLQYDECDLLTPFVDAGKAVFGIEYLDDPADFCSATNAMNFDWLKKPWDLTATRESCR